MNISEKLRKLFDIKSGLKSALDEIGQTPGKRFAEWPGLVKYTGSGDGESMFKPYFDETETILTDRDPYEVWKAEKCIYDTDEEHLILVEKLRDISAADIVLWILPACNLQWRKLRDSPVINDASWGSTSYDVLTDYETASLILGMDFSFFDYGTSSTLFKNIAPVSAVAMEIAHMNFFSLTESNTRYFTFKYLPNVRKVSGFSTGGSTTLNYAFSCFAGESLSNLEIDCTGVTDLSGMFMGCANLKEFPSLVNTGTVNNIERLFRGCSGLQSIDLTPLSGMTGVTGLSYLLYGCSGLQSVDLTPLSGMTGVMNLSYMFNGCSVLQSVDLTPLSGMTKVISLAHMFDGCYGLQSVDPTPLSGMTGVTSLSYMFNYCRGLQSVDLTPFSGMTGVTILSYMFNGCSRLQSVDLTPLSGMTGVTSLATMFSGCTLLENVHVGGIYIDSVKASNGNYTGLGSMFSGCNSLTTVTGSFTGTIKQDGFDLGSSPLTADSCMVFFDALDSNYAYTIKIHKTTYEALSEEHLAVATSKGWTVSVS